MLMGNVVHMKIFAEVPTFGKLWDVLCGFEAWNGILMTEDSDEVTCQECTRRVKEWRCKRKSPIRTESKEKK
jgi:hypothetical protein